ncbi:hypothetical protein BJV74DRAFT_890625 [Russula compacta]|nr:hypothetical protein BJV74DRAFT_890625 [Russula compacta]
MIHAGGEPQPRAAVEGADDNDNDDNGPAPGPKMLSSVELAQLPAQGYPNTIEALAVHIKQP